MIENEKFKKFIIKETLEAVAVNSSIENWAKSIGIDLRENQLEIMENILNPSIRNIVILASRSGGKTFTVSVACIKQCIENKGYRIVLLGPKADLAARIIKDGIVPICKNNDILSAEIDWVTTTQKEVKFKNGSWVRALSANENTQVEGHHCLTGDTLVLMKDGSQKPISNVKIGDLVKTINYGTSEIEDKRVEAFSIKESDDLYEISFDINGEIKTVECTGNHKWITLNRDIVETKDLTEDDIILGFCMELIVGKVKSVKKVNKKALVYNMTVEDNHNYFANGVNTKNCDMLVLDEAHQISNLVYKLRVSPMNQDSDKQKNIKIGITLYDNHLRDSATRLPGWKVLCYPWYKCPYLYKKNDLITVDGVEYPKGIVDQMPLSMKIKRWPNNPEMHYESNNGMLEEEFKTQYEMEWTDTIGGLLTTEDQERLLGTHDYLYEALPEEKYFFGLDFAGGSLVKQVAERDSTQLVIGRLTPDHKKEVVALYSWQGDTTVQAEEIIHIITKVFPCEFGCADYSTMGIGIVDQFLSANIPLAGISYKKTEPISGKNYKNSIFDQFLYELRHDRFKYPSLNHLLVNNQITSVEAKLLNDHIIQWCSIQRTKKPTGINDEISAPKESKVHDDCPNAAALFVWACDKCDVEKENLGLYRKNFKMPRPQFGPTTTQNRQTISSGGFGHNMFGRPGGFKWGR